jgi:hypothetical protein
MKVHRCVLYLESRGMHRSVGEGDGRRRGSRGGGGVVARHLVLLLLEAALLVEG